MADSNADHIRRRMAEVRYDLQETASDIRSQSRQLGDWHYYVRRYPWAVMAAAACVGFALVPRKRKLYFRADGVAPQTLPAGSHVVIRESSSPLQALAAAAVSSIGSLAIRLATHHAAHLFSGAASDGNAARAAEDIGREEHFHR